jgi:hypothetical protein
LNLRVRVPGRPGRRRLKFTEVILAAAAAAGRSPSPASVPVPVLPVFSLASSSFKFVPLPPRQIGPGPGGPPGPNPAAAAGGRGRFKLCRAAAPRRPLDHCHWQVTHLGFAVPAQPEAAPPGPGPERQMTRKPEAGQSRNPRAPLPPALGLPRSPGRRRPGLSVLPPAQFSSCRPHH